MNITNYAVELIAISKKFVIEKVLKDLDLKVNHREILALLGPSGCGKSTTLNIIAGFLSPDHGHVILDGKSVDNIPTSKRNLGMVFQNYSLFPHYNVFNNVAFGLSVRKIPKSEIHERVMAALSLVRLSDTIEKFPAQLSGGQQQRIALARALIVKPKVLLMDEPLSNLDARLRKELQIELKRIQQDTGVTMIYVTHDQEEAVTLADRIALMRNGVIEQLGDPNEVYEYPISRYTAHFMGFNNFIKGEMVRKFGDELIFKLKGDNYVRLKNPHKFELETSALIAIRDERIFLEDKSSESRDVLDSVSIENHDEGEGVNNRLSGIIKECVYTGECFIVYVTCTGDLNFQLRVPAQRASNYHLQIGSSVNVYLPPEDLRLLLDR